MDTSKESFMQEFNKIVEDFFAGSVYPQKLVKRTKQMIEYILPDYSKTIVPSLILKVAKIIKPNLNDEELQIAVLLGWIYQLFEAYIFTGDDYFDDGEQRYGKMCWSKLNKHSKSVIVHDVALIRQLTFFAIQQMFPNSAPIVDLFLFHDNEFTKGFILEANLQMKSYRDGKVELEELNMENYRLMAALKVRGFVYLPVALAMIATGFKVSKIRDFDDKIKKIFYDLAIMAAVFDDYSENIAAPSPSKIADSDIRRGQFTWLFVIAKERCQDSIETEKLTQHYGKDNNESVSFIKEFYESIGIHDLFQKYCENEYKNIMKKVDTCLVEGETFHDILRWYIPFMINFLKSEASGILD